MGDKEKKTKNPVMATVGNSIRRLNQIYEEMDGVEPVLEWNEGFPTETEAADGASAGK